MIKARRLIWLLAFFTSSLFAQNYSLNEKVIQQDSLTTDFSFLVGGHFYGSAKVKNGVPAATVLASLGLINSSGAKFIVSLGDLFSDIKNDIPFTKSVFIDRLNFPIYNVVGDHDQSLTSNIYQENFGETFFSFIYQGNLFLFFDTEKDDGSIQGQQLTLLEKTLKGNYKNIFIFSHRPIWSEEKDHLKNVFKGNDRSNFGNNYLKAVEPLLMNLPENNEIFWFSGSLGASPSSFFYHQENERLHFIQTAIKDRKQDGILNISVKNGIVDFETVSLTGQSLESLTSYTVDYWSKGGNTFDTPGLISTIKSMLLHQFFWFGMAIAFGIIIFLMIIKRILFRGNA